MIKTKQFKEIYEDFDTFKTEYTASVFKDAISNDNLEILYYILYGRHYNDYITNLDVDQFKYKLFNIIWQYGPTWEKRLDIQDEIRSLTSEDLLKGATAIYNHAFNPETEPSTQTTTELDFVNEQNVTKYEKTKMDAYGQLWNLLATDVTEQFVSRFNSLFKKFIPPYNWPQEDEEDV